jgi:hypothetical protein
VAFDTTRGGFQPLPVTRDQHDIRAQRRQMCGNCLTQPMAGPGHYGHFVG